MPKATNKNITNRRAFLSMAAAVPAAVAVAAAPIAAAAPADHRAGKAAIDPRTVIDLVANQFLTVPLATIAEDDHHVVIAMRLPREASPDYDGLLALAYDDKFGADVAAWIAERLKAA